MDNRATQLRSSAKQLPTAGTPEAERESRHVELLELLRRDPEAGARQLFRVLGPDVNRLVWRLLGADPEHNDVVQQVFFKVLSRWQSIRDPGSFTAWVHSITVNTVYEELRRRELQRLLRISWRPPRVHGDLVQEMEARDFLISAMNLVSKLPAKLRIVFVLRFVEGKTLPQIAQLCDYSEGTAKRRLRAATGRFQKLVAKQPELAQCFESPQTATGGRS
jgi:RNA polymerase sigma-70 factor, ECF subfamily